MARAPWRVRRLAKRLGVPEEACSTAVRSTERRLYWPLQFICGVPGLICFWGYFFLIGRAIDALEDAGYAPAIWATRSLLGMSLLLMFNYAVAIALLSLGVYTTRYLILCRILRHYRGERLCDRCGHSLAGLLDPGSPCPECGA